MSDKQKEVLGLIDQLLNEECTAELKPFVELRAKIKDIDKQISSKDWLKLWCSYSANGAQKTLNILHEINDKNIDEKGISIWPKIIRRKR